MKGVMVVLGNSMGSLNRAIEDLTGFRVSMHMALMGTEDRFLRFESDLFNGSALGIMQYAVKDVRLSGTITDPQRLSFDLWMSYDMLVTCGGNGACLGVAGKRINLAWDSGSKEWRGRLH